MILYEINSNRVIEDLESTIEYVSEKGGIPTAGKNSTFPTPDLLELNRRMSHPITIDHTRPRQASYPFIDVVYMLLRSTGLLVVQKKARVKVLLIQPEVLKQWRKLSHEEQYGNLLAHACFPSSFDIICRHNCSWPPNFNYVIKYYVGCRGEDFLESSNLTKYYLAALYLFGFVNITSGSPEPGKGWNILSVRIDRAARQLSKPVSDACWNSITHMDLSNWIRAFRKEMQRALPNWKQILEPKFEGIRKDFLTFSVKEPFTGAKRVVEIPGSFTLHDLSKIIIDSCEMDHTHGYYFEYKDHTGRNIKRYHPYFTNEITKADEILLNTLPLNQGDTLRFRFDFGDDWNFTLRILKNDSKKTDNIHLPSVIMTNGIMIDA